MIVNIEELNILDVSHSKNEYVINGFGIRFEIDGFRYVLSAVEQDDGRIHPKCIDHLSKNFDCTYCNGKELECKGLMISKQDLFHRLIDFPSIRLEWLYINHV